MSRFPEPGRQAAHVLIDAASVAIGDLQAIDATNLAYQRLMEIDHAIDVTVNDPGPDSDIEVDINLSNILGPTLITLHWAITRISTLEGSTPEDVIAALRDYVDS